VSHTPQVPCASERRRHQTLRRQAWFFLLVTDFTLLDLSSYLKIVSVCAGACTRVSNTSTRVNKYSYKRGCQFQARARQAIRLLDQNVGKQFARFHLILYYCNLVVCDRLYSGFYLRNHKSASPTVLLFMPSSQLSSPVHLRQLCYTPLHM
jgi:hypothetical protein